MSEETLDQWTARIQEIGALEFRRRLLVQLTAVSLKMDSMAKRNARSRMRVRSGRLWQSVRGMVVDDQGAPMVMLQAGGRVSGGEVIYAGIQEFGGIITPKVSDYLRIPLSPALTAAGVDRYGGRLRTTGAGLFFPFRSKDGDLYLAHRDGNGLEPWYKLVDRVTVPAHHFLRDAFNMAVGEMSPLMIDVWRVSLLHRRAA